MKTVYPRKVDIPMTISMHEAIKVTAEREGCSQGKVIRMLIALGFEHLKGQAEDKAATKALDLESGD
jgi:hypothetical protein